MKTRKLGEIEVSEIGMGCMAFSHGYGQIPAEEYSIEAIRSAQQHGCTLFDTAEVYSPGLSGIGHNERIVGKALRGVRDDVVIATKLFLGYGSVYDKVREHLEDSLERLQTDWVDIYYLHRTGGASVEGLRGEKERHARADFPCVDAAQIPERGADPRLEEQGAHH